MESGNPDILLLKLGSYNSSTSDTYTGFWYISYKLLRSKFIFFVTVPVFCSMGVFGLFAFFFALLQQLQLQYGCHTGRIPARSIVVLRSSSTVDAVDACSRATHTLQPTASMSATRIHTSSYPRDSLEHRQARQYMCIKQMASSCACSSTPCSSSLSDVFDLHAFAAISLNQEPVQQCQTQWHSFLLFPIPSQSHVTTITVTMRPSSSHLRSASPLPAPLSDSESSASSISFESSPQMLQHDPPVVPIAPLSQFLDLLTPLPPAAATAAHLVRRLIKDRPSFFFICEIPCARKYVAVARSGLFATFDSSCLSCTLISTLSCDSHGAPPPLLCAAVTNAHSACLPPLTINGSSPAPQLSSPRRRAPPCPRGDVLAAITCQSVICLYDLAAVVNGNFGASTDGLLQPIVKIIMGFKVVMSSNPAHKH